MSDPSRIKRPDPARTAPIRDWSNMFQSPAASAGSARAADHAAPNARLHESIANGANGPVSVRDSASPSSSISEEARVGIETAYRVIDEHLQEGRRAAQEQRAGEAAPAAFAGAAGAGIATDSIQEIVAQGMRFYSSLAMSLIKAIANSTPQPETAHRETAATGLAPAPLAPAPIPRAATASSPSIIVEIASSRMTRVTVDLAPSAATTEFVIGGLHALEADKPALREISLAIEVGSNRPVMRIRVPENQPPGVYSGVILERESGQPRGTVILRIDA
jgi:hypothetical protein